MLCKIFHKSGAGPPNGDRYAPFIEEEWDEDAPLVVPGEVMEDGVANGDEVHVLFILVQDFLLWFRLLINCVEIYVFD